MGLNIKNAEVERLAAEIAATTGETKTEAIRKALEERKARLAGAGTEERMKRWREFMQPIWDRVPTDAAPITRDDFDALYE